jgi:cation:H+ antiporter
MILNIIFIFISAALLWSGASWIVTSASAIARKFRLSELVIGLTVVALGTSLPEFFVTATAAFKGLSDISMSNIVGSNIFNLGLILGLMAMIEPVATHRTLIFRDGLVLWGLTIFILVSVLDLKMGRGAGIVLLLCLVLYNGYIILRRGKLPEDMELPSQREATWLDYPGLVAGFVMVSYGGHLMVDAASTLARQAGISEWAIGVTIVAAGTSLPELVTCLAASLKGKSDMLLGNLIGSDIFNFAGVLGVTCVLKPLSVSASALPSLYSLVAMVFLVLVFMRTGWRVSRLEGACLLCINLLRWAKDFL